MKKNSLTGKVLLAEDTPENQVLISMYLRRAGAEVVVVENGELAVKEALKQDFDLVLMDIQMPVMDGLKATKKLREANYSKPIVAVTANVLKEDKEKSKSAGIDEYLTKPLDLPRFHKILKSYLSKRQEPEPPHDESHSITVAGMTDIEDDPEFQQLREKFFAGLSEQVGLIREAYQKQHWDNLHIIAHKLKGLGTSFGQQNITEYAAKIQNLILTEKYQQLDQSIEQLIAECEMAASSQAHASKVS